MRPPLGLILREIFGVIPLRLPRYQGRNPPLPSSVRSYLKGAKFNKSDLMSLLKKREGFNDERRFSFILFLVFKFLKQKLSLIRSESGIKKN